jgi:hypothetical protein
LPAIAAAPLNPTLPAIMQTLPKSPLCDSAALTANVGMFSIICIQTPFPKYFTSNVSYGQ